MCYCCRRFWKQYAPTIRLVHSFFCRVQVLWCFYGVVLGGIGVFTLSSSLQVRGRALKPALCRLHHKVPPALTMWWRVVAFPPSQDGDCQVAPFSCRTFCGVALGYLIPLL